MFHRMFYQCYICVWLSFLYVPDSTPDKLAELLLESDEVMSRWLHSD